MTSCHSQRPSHLPDARARRKAELHPSIRDFLLIPLFHLCVLLFHSTCVRLLVALALLPLYCARQTVSVLPNIVQNAHLLFTSKGRFRLCQASDSYRQKEQKIAWEQYNGTYKFSPSKILTWNDCSHQKPERVEIEVCGIKARIVHAKPPILGKGSKRLLMVHGNPSWGYIWRNVIPTMNAAGHEVFSIDWLGHGASDKPTDPREISFELHMQTLVAVIRHFDLDDFYIAAHDWGGCIVLCTVPSFPEGHRCAGLFLLNTFLPPRPQDISLHYYLLYWIWFFSTGVFGPLLPESLVLRFMAPNITKTVAEGYSIPYRQCPTKTKASTNRFAHIVPGIPDSILDQRSRFLWRMVEGLIGPEHLTNINAQASLARRDVEVRRWWSGEEIEKENAEKRGPGGAGTDRASSAPGQVMVVFGQDDPLLPEFRQILVDTVKVSKLVANREGDWIAGAGHYPMEQTPDVIAKSIDSLLKG